MAQAKMIAAANASYSAVSEAIAAAQPGDTVVVPSGKATWSSQLIITKSLSLIGAGAGSTVITSGIGNLNALLDRIHVRRTLRPIQPFRDFRISLSISLIRAIGIFLDGTQEHEKRLPDQNAESTTIHSPGRPNHALGPQALHIRRNHGSR